MARVTSKDLNYSPGDLSSFPSKLDDRSNTIEAKNNARSVLRTPLRWNSDVVFVKDPTNFPIKAGIIRVNDELIFYENRIGDRFMGVVRGFMESTVFDHKEGAPVIAPAMADMHNTLRDILIKAQLKTGLRSDVSDSDLRATFFSRVSFLRKKWFTPKARFFSWQRRGYAPHGVQFVDFSLGEPARWYWEFGDGQISTEQNPYHSYQYPGTYDVQLTIFTAPRNSSQGSSSVLKRGYVEIVDTTSVEQVLFYAKGVDNQGKELENLTGKTPFLVRFYDQTTGSVGSRIWSFGDGLSLTVEDPNQYIVEHVYDQPGQFTPSLAINDGELNYRRNLEAIIRVTIA